MSNSIKEKTDQEIFFPEGKEVFIYGEKFVIKPFVLENRTRVLKLLMGMIADFTKDNPNIDKDKVNFNSVVVDFISNAGERIIEIYEIVLGKERDWLNKNIQLKHEIEIITAVFELNDFPFLISQVKQLIEKVNPTT